MTTTWKIVQTDYLVANGFITTAHWTAIVVDGEYTAGSYGSCNFAFATPSIPYDQVTEQEVLNWCWKNGINKNLVETQLAEQILVLQNPIFASGLSWTN